MTSPQSTEPLIAPQDAGQAVAGAESGSVAVFSVRGGSVRLDGRPVLHDVDLAIQPGEVVSVLGANGSGKSTLIRAMLGLVPLSAGSATIFGVPPGRFRAWRRIGYVPQRLTVGGGVPATVREVVGSGRTGRMSRFRPMSARDKRAIDEALATVGLSDRARDSASRLSGGQQQRVLIARALAGEPDVFVLDEPTAGVDAASQEALARTIRQLVAHGRTIVLVAHELGPLHSVIGRSVILDAGHVVHDGPPPGDVGFEGHGHTYTHRHA